MVSYGALTLDPAQRRVTLTGRAVRAFGARVRGARGADDAARRGVSREQLEDAVYGWGEEIEQQRVEVHIHQLRRKLGADLIRNVRGVGYRIAALE